MKPIYFFAALLLLLVNNNTFAQRNPPKGDYKTFNKKVLDNQQTFATQACNSNTTICQTGVAGPFNFEASVPNFHRGCQIGEDGAFKFAFILLNISTNGPLNLLVEGDGGFGYLDVLIFNIPDGEIPCNAIVNPANMLSCNYAANEGGCVQFGNSFPCNSPVTAPLVTAGSQLMVVVQDYSDTNNSFTIQLGPGAQTAPPDATINPVAPVCQNNGLVTLTAGTNGGLWSGPGVSPEGIFDPATAGIGTHTINYSVGIAPCDANSSTTIEVLEAPTANFSVNNAAICATQTLELLGTAVPTATYLWTGPDGWTSTLLNPVRPNIDDSMGGFYVFEVTLPNGCSEEASQNLMLDPNSNVITQNITANLDASGNVTITPNQIDNGSTNSCGITNRQLDRNTFSCADLGDNTVTLTITAANGNVSSATAVVTVVDNISPISLTQNISVVLDAAGQATIVPSQIDAGSTDNCGITTITLDKDTFSCADIGNNTVTLTVTDTAGNSSSATTIVNVSENIPPIAIAQNINVTLNTDGVAVVTPADIDNGSTDNCAISSMTISQENFSCQHIGTNNITLTVTDISGNTTTTSATVTVEPIPLPTTSNSTQEFCRVNMPTVADLMVNEPNVRFFSTTDSTVPFPPETPLYSQTYYAAFVFGTCVGENRLPIAVIISDTSPPTALTTQEFCLELNPTVADLIANEPSIVWYDVPENGTALASSEILQSNTSYYAAQIENGCESSQRLEVLAVVNECDVFVHNAVTPNNDGRNDYFSIRNIERHPENNLQIFNRYGSLVFETKNYGTHNNYFKGIANKGPNVATGTQLLPHGTYFYVFNYTGIDGTSKSKSGYLHLTY